MCTCIIIFITPHNKSITLLEVTTIVYKACDKQVAMESLWLRGCSYRVYIHYNSHHFIIYKIYILCVLLCTIPNHCYDC